MALLNGEQGSDRVRDALNAGAIISTVNLSEAVARLTSFGVPADQIRVDLRGLDLEIEDFVEADAYVAGLIKPLTDAQNLSFADRACLALARRLRLPVLTADRPWLDVPLNGNPKIELIR